MTFNDFVQKYKFKKRPTNIRNNYQVISSFSLNDVDIYLQDGPFSSDIGIVKLHPSKGTHWVAYMNENYFDNYGWSPPQKLSKFIKKRNRHCLYSEYNIQGLTNQRDSYCASYCLYIIHLTKVLGIEFKSAVLNFCYQMM